ncbi:MAG: metal-dependent transcriptional regulator [Oscillospiraceae bacterium]
MNSDSEFHTLKGYQQHSGSEMTSSMEDYLEMICRMLKNHDVVRISELAQMLNVKPSSASKMVNNLKNDGLVLFERYGYVKLTEKGGKAGEYLLYRHDVLHRFLCSINDTEDETEQVEKIEHFLNEDTVRNIDRKINKNTT